MPEHSWMEMVWFYKDKIQLACFALLFLFCLVRRLPAPECILAGLLFAMGPVDRLYHLAVGGAVLWHRANLGHLCIDALAMGCFFVIALKANRVYPLWIAGAQIIAMSGHFYRLALTEINTFAYDVMAITPSYIQLVALLLGVVFHMSRRKRLGSYPSWRIYSPPTQEMPAKISLGA
ncbi:hypothetical protein [Novosphingobium guangzhouense]|uniref:Uncharacterized protein n=1 Tax=Novosphingobium guangzhouense TaxID=1850347 RepID=A0A2K2G2T0_9SPHN|nr:hypothetical protein [Novosphingobium guangzhouense]PNU05337.1 hypothetical protein A8V01_17365 [Novosphingobium guangzhouense]